MKAQSFILLLLMHVIVAPVKAYPRDMFVNMPKILSNGDAYAGKEIILTGYMCQNPDSRGGLFMTIDDCNYSNYDSAIRLNLPEKKSSCNGLTQVKGVFNYKKNQFVVDELYAWGEMNVSTILCLPRQYKSPKTQ